MYSLRAQGVCDTRREGERERERAREREIEREREHGMCVSVGERESEIAGCVFG